MTESHSSFVPDSPPSSPSMETSPTPTSTPPPPPKPESLPFTPQSSEEAAHIEIRHSCSEISRYAQIVNLPNHTSLLAQQILKKTHSQVSKATKNRYGIIAACIFIACRSGVETFKYQTILNLMRVSFSLGLRILLAVETAYVRASDGGGDGYGEPIMVPEHAEVIDVHGRLERVCKGGGSKVFVSSRYDSRDTQFRSRCCLPEKETGEHRALEEAIKGEFAKGEYGAGGEVGAGWVLVGNVIKAKSGGSEKDVMVDGGAVKTT